MSIEKVETFISFSTQGVPGIRDIWVKTTGASYHITPTGIKMFGRIDVHENDYRETPELMAEIIFAEYLEDLAVVGMDEGEVGIGENQGPSSQYCQITSSRVRLEFRSDSLFFITNKAGVEGSTPPFYYVHVNRLRRAEWRKTFNIGPAPGRPEGISPSDPRNFTYDYRDRMWSDGEGGSLHAHATDSMVTAYTSMHPHDDDVPDLSGVYDDHGAGPTNFTLFRLGAPIRNTERTDVLAPVYDTRTGEYQPVFFPQMAHMVFPPRFFDFSKLYGDDSGQSYPYYLFEYCSAPKHGNENYRWLFLDLWAQVCRTPGPGLGSTVSDFANYLGVDPILPSYRFLIPGHAFALAA